MSAPQASCESLNTGPVESISLSQIQTRLATASLRLHRFTSDVVIDILIKEEFVANRHTVRVLCKFKKKLQWVTTTSQIISRKAPRRLVTSHLIALHGGTVYLGLNSTMVLSNKIPVNIY